MAGLPLDEFDSVCVKELTRHTFSYHIPTIDVAESNLPWFSIVWNGALLCGFEKDFEKDALYRLPL